MSEHVGEIVLSVTAEDIPWDYTREHQRQGVYLWLCDTCHFNNWPESDKCERCGEHRHRGCP
jgi:hypothetical protein